ncbi:MAG: helix-turn-helix transcriptional regulator [Gemmatimonadetes bacterium]|uniref:Helix-turn-helix transcriptional regulator n=1 Tax=Candidatus Kutchimonas denitrificans TaxID=3056748 RepID=A0AAE5CD66_9BACT|nr:helix-turn-helix transcriptional regulator [Gemmatimonadota bacterium]NIR76695.1 helix-turn-helix transcriptional regulator [Candidatus Kutchimonas denitrificans]NIS01182.1 helix-turn-helix transcriptional regulator [Gemmatimonadota bacterium]NIT68221.1 helix-turn-helix transcriptional regulator [Gemmatimonadota bacterium]NIW75439.1 helix-turn-helix domain-containing protein [Gemmatimonadota bacterium]
MISGVGLDGVTESSIGMSAAGYWEIPPGPVLAPFVDCFWIRRGSLPPNVTQRNRILPDGRIDILFVLGDDPERAAPVPRAGSYAVGTMRRALVLDLEGRFEFLGVRFAPGAAASFLGLPAAEITDQTVALEGCWGRSALELEERLRDVAPGLRVPLVRAELEVRLVRFRPPSALVLAASSLIAKRIGRIKVSELCRTLGVGERRLRRLFASSVGLSPKEACRVARFVHAAELLRRPEGSDLARVSARAGYYDQPHFIREFRRLSGLTPGSYLAERRAVRSVQSRAARSD